MMLMSGGKAIKANYTQPLSTRSLFKGTKARLSCKNQPHQCAAAAAAQFLTSQFYKICDIIYSVPHYCFSCPR